MYQAHFGFSAKPFQLNPDPSFYYDSSQHHRAMSFVEYGLHQAEGFVVVTGEVGAGKTTLVRSLLGRLDARRVVAANIVTTQLDADDMLRIVAAAFGVRTKDAPKSELLLGLEAVLTDHARQRKRCILIVDEAQNLTQRAVEELRMLSNFQLGSQALLQSFLVGQPEFRLLLQSQGLSQLRQRVIAACHIGPLDAHETRRYVEHRLAKVGWRGNNPLITNEAYEALHLAAEGIPRRVNLLCDRALLAAYLEERHVIALNNVRDLADEVGRETLAVRDLQGEGAPLPPPVALAAPMDLTLPAPPAPERAPGAQIEQEVRELRDALARMERGNLATLGVFRRLLEWMKSQEPGRSDH